MQGLKRCLPLIPAILRVITAAAAHGLFARSKQLIYESGERLRLRWPQRAGRQAGVLTGTRLHELVAARSCETERELPADLLLVCCGCYYLPR